MEEQKPPSKGREFDEVGDDAVNGLLFHKLQVFHLIIADSDVYATASEYVLEQMQVVGKTLEVLEIVCLLAVPVTYTHPPVVEFSVINTDANAFLAVIVYPLVR